MKYFVSLLFIFIPVSLQNQVLKDGDPKCRYRVHLPSASWHTAYDICKNSNQELARIGSTNDKNFIHDILIDVDSLVQEEPMKGNYSDVWIGAFMRSSSNESMHLNCKTFGLPVKITEPRPKDEFVCIYYNITDRKLYVDNCFNSKAFVCENKSKAKADCMMISLKGELNDAHPYILGKDGKTTDNCDEICCKKKCMGLKKYYMFIWNRATNKCDVYRYLNDTTPQLLHAVNITHKSFFVFKKEYPESPPQPLSVQCPEMTPELIQKKADELKTNLTVKRKETNKFKRTLISAPDERRSAKNMGMVGVTVICLVAGVFVFFDCVNFLQRVKCVRPRVKAD